MLGHRQTDAGITWDMGGLNGHSAARGGFHGKGIGQASSAEDCFELPVIATKAIRDDRAERNPDIERGID
jgi:hypothetical protein